MREGSQKIRIYGELIVAPLEKIRPNPWNPKPSDADRSMIRQSIGRLGYKRPIVVYRVEENGEEYYRIIDGEQRWRVLAQEGVAEVEVFLIPIQDDETAKLLMINFQDARVEFDLISLAELVKQRGDLVLPYTPKQLNALFISNQTELNKKARAKEVKGIKPHDHQPITAYMCVKCGLIITKEEYEMIFGPKKEDGETNES